MSDSDFLFPANSFQQVFSEAPARVHDAWHSIGQNPRHLLDANCDMWEELFIGTKIAAIKTIAQYAYLDRVLVDYMVRCRQHAPEYLTGLGSAIVAYAAEGYQLRLPISPLVGGIVHPGYVASLARMLEDNKLDCVDLEWLGIELRRLRRATDGWLATHIGYNEDS